MTFEFTYDKSWYKFEDGKLLKQNAWGKYDQYFNTGTPPVLAELQTRLEAIPEDIRPVVMQGLMHAYTWGVYDGKQEKIREFKGVFAID